MLVGGAELLVRGGGQVALGLRIPAMIVGLTVVAFGTSAPELAVSVSAAWKGSTDAAMGNVLGSNIANILLVLGVGALVNPLAVDRGLIKRDLPALLFIQLLLPLLCLDGRVGFIDGLVLLGLCLVYNGILIRQALRDRSASFAEEEEPPQTRMWLDVIFLLVGLALLVAGAQVFVGSALELAGWFGLSDRLVGLTIIALGTSAPELVTTGLGAWKGEVDLALGNVIGSNIFNLALVLGMTAVLHPVIFNDSRLWIDIGVACGATLLLLPVALFAGRIGRIFGGLMLASYVAYLYFSA